MESVIFLSFNVKYNSFEINKLSLLIYSQKTSRLLSGNKIQKPPFHRHNCSSCVGVIDWLRNFQSFASQVVLDQFHHFLDKLIMKLFRNGAQC